MALIVVAQFMVVLDVAIVNVALPSIKDDLDFSQESLQWVITGYSIMSAPLRSNNDRGPALATEQIVDELAYAVRRDPLEFRRQNMGATVQEPRVLGPANKVGIAEDSYVADRELATVVFEVRIGHGVAPVLDTILS